MKTILFDGVCNLCNSSVNWVIDHDKKGLFSFASLQSEFGKRRAKELGLGEDYMDTIVFDDEGTLYTQSSAVIKVLRYMGGVYSASIFLLLIPTFIRDFVYKTVANNRYKWFGKRDVCRVPTPELKARFLE
jgi:predicted DCC family thiol-disulfide oxidoreductase YuxK